MDNKPWYKSLTLWSAAITAVSVFAPKYAPIIPDVASGVVTIAGLIGTVIGRIRATQGVALTAPKSE